MGEQSMKRSGTTPTLCMFTVLLAFSCAAADVSVLNADDSGPGSLRQAMQDVPAGGTIDFDPGFFNVARTINITSTLETAQSMTITGPGADLLTISGDNTFTIFDTSDDNVTLIGMTI